MIINIIRPEIKDTPYTISQMYIDGVFYCHVMEDRDRNLFQNNPKDVLARKVKHETAIPYGSYQLAITFSDRFQKFLPLLLNVVGFLGIRIHAGNTQADSSGCLLLGIWDGVSSRVHSSRKTVTSFISLVSKRMKTEKVIVNILPSNNLNATTA